jgi:hypothetical protein
VSTRGAVDAIEAFSGLLLDFKTTAKRWPGDWFPPLPVQHARKVRLSPYHLRQVKRKIDRQMFGI